MNDERFKTRSSLFLYKMSDAVKAKLEETEQKTGVAKWLIVEKILEDSFGIRPDEGIDIEKFLGVTAHRAKVGKSRKKAVTK